MHITHPFTSGHQTALPPNPAASCFKSVQGFRPPTKTTVLTPWTSHKPLPELPHFFRQTSGAPRPKITKPPICSELPPMQLKRHFLEKPSVKAPLEMHAHLCASVMSYLAHMSGSTYLCHSCLSSCLSPRDSRSVPCPVSSDTKAQQMFTEWIVKLSTPPAPFKSSPFYSTIWLCEQLKLLERRQDTKRNLVK